MQGIRGKLSKASLWLSASRAVVNVLAFLSTIMLARLLVPVDFGIVAIATTMLAIITAFTTLSMGQALIQTGIPTRAHLDTAWTLDSARGILLALLFAALAVPTASFFEDPRLIGVMLALGVGVAVNGFVNPRRAMAQRELVFWQDFAIEVSGKLAGLIAGIATALIFRNYWALVVGSLASQLVSTIVMYIILPYRPRVSLAAFRDLWSFSAWLTLSQIINTLNWRFDQLLIGKFLGRNDVGLYTVADNLAQLPTREATMPLTNVLFPAFSQLKNDPHRLRDAYNRAQGLVSAVALPAGVGMALIAEPMVRLAMGEKWLPAVFVIQALAAIFAVQTIGSLATPLALALGQTKLVFRRDCQLFAIRIPIITVGLALGGLNGVVVARVLTGLIALAFNVSIARDLTGFSIYEQVRFNVRILLAIAVMAASVIGSMAIWPPAFTTEALVTELAAFVAIGGISYLGAMVLLWLAARRPAGTEAEVASLLATMSRRVRTSCKRVRMR